MITQEIVEDMAAAMNPYWFEDNAEGEFPEQVEQKRRLWKSYSERGLAKVYPLIRQQVISECEARCKEFGFFAPADDFENGYNTALGCALTLLKSTMKRKDTQNEPR
jgi:hypothetical protein